MHKGSPKNCNYAKWEHLENAPVSNSLILGTNTQSPKNYHHTPRPKLEDFGFKHGQFVRHDSEKQFNKPDLYRNPNFLMPPDLSPRFDEENKPKASIPINDRVRNSDIYSNRPSNPNSRTPEMKPGFFMARKSGGKPNALKETSSTSNSNDALASHKS